jgi:hypothetical protein
MSAVIEPWMERHECSINGLFLRFSGGGGSPFVVEIQALAADFPKGQNRENFPAISERKLK